MNPARHRLFCGLALAILTQGTANAQSASAPDGLSSPIAALLAQAQYWQAHGQPAQSLESLSRVLLLAPANADALALRIKIELAQGDNIAANQDLATLKRVQPTAPALPSLVQLQTEAANPVDPHALEAARAAAKNGQYAQAVDLYQQSFHGTTPPSGYAAEYYETLAGTPEGYDKAIAGLGDLVSQAPDNLQTQLAFATVQTYQPSTRQTGIARLQQLVNYPAIAGPAQHAWKQSLTYLPANSSSVPLYQAYLAKYPDDTAVTELLATARAPHPMSPAETEAANRARGFDALKSNQLDSAAALFQAAITANPADADALGGLGLVRLRQGQTSAAQDLLRRAIAANPEQGGQWQAALNGATQGAAYATATALTRQGDLSGAARQLRAIIASGGNVTGAEAMLANVQTQQGDLTGAATSWRAVLARDPNNGPALAGLGTILAQQGDQQGAQALFQRAAANGQSEAVSSAQAMLLRNQAAQTRDPTVALALYRAAVAAAPQDPWARLDLARALRNAGQDSDATAQMNALTAAPAASVAALQAGALFASEDNRPADAQALIARLPASGLTPDMLAIRSRGAFLQQIANAQAQAAGNPALVRQSLVTLAAAPDPDGSRGAAIADALAKAGDGTGAQLAIQAAIAANPSAGPATRIRYVGALMKNNQDGPAAQIVQSLQAQGGLTADQQASLASLRDGLSVRASDRLASQGRLADAYNQLSPGLAQDPADPILNSALARLYVANHQPRQALAINQALLQANPNDLDARAGAVDAAIAASDWKTASTLVQDGQTQQPNEPRVWLMAADIARARGHPGAAVTDLQTAQSLRQQQLAAQSGGSGAMVLASAAPVSVNPFGTPSSGSAGAAIVPSVLSTQSGFSTANPVQTDLLSQQIASQISDLQKSEAPTIQASIAPKSRSGSAGLDQLQTIGAPIIGSYSPHGVGTITLTATPTYLSAGQLSSDATAQTKFGSDALGTTIAPKSQTAAGVGLDAAFSLPWGKIDIGSTPLGFRTENLIGGVELTPSLANGLRFSLSAQRVPVTDSLLSYASTVDPRTGTTFGGVLRDRAAGQISMSIGPGYVYAGGGFDQLTGRHVAKNTEVEFGAGGAYPVEHSQTTNTNVGVNLTYFSYSKNLRYFTLGQGGYFSPQSYFAATVPIDYKETDGNLTWAVGGSVGLQSYSENSSPYFPIDPTQQAQLVAAVAAATTATADSAVLAAYYPSSTHSGIIGGAHGSFEYQLNNGIAVGGSLSYNRAGDWNETQGLVYVRYLFGNGKQ
jgi:Tfp pilus assembly protein PilF